MRYPGTGGLITRHIELSDNGGEDNLLGPSLSDIMHPHSEV